MNMTFHFGKLRRTLCLGPKISGFYLFLFVISAEFIIRYFALGIDVEKRYQICLLNFKSSLIAEELVFILCSFLSDDVRNLAYGKKVNF